MIADPAWKSALLHKGQDVADLLEAVLSGSLEGEDRGCEAGDCPRRNARWSGPSNRPNSDGRGQEHQRRAGHCARRNEGAAARLLSLEQVIAKA